MPGDDEKIAELNAIIQAVRDRVRARYPKPEDGVDEKAGHSRIQIALADLMPVVHARDAAQAKIAAIGSVNPRPGGLANKLIQAWKKFLARVLGWFVRDQIVFNRESISAIEAVLEALNEHNRILLSLASQANEQIAGLRTETESYVKELTRQIDARSAELSREMNHRVGDLSAALSRHVRELNDKVEDTASQLSRQIDARAKENAALVEARAAELSRQIDARAKEISDSVMPVVTQVDLLKSETLELKDIRKHWIEWRAGWEQKLATNEIQFLRSVADLQGAFQHRSTQMEANFRDIVKSQHADYLGALDRTTLDIQKRLWSDLEKARGEFERLIYTELRLLRQRGGVVSQVAPAMVAVPVAQSAAPAEPAFDYGRFAERFRGDEAYVRSGVEFYLPHFKGRENVVDIGCGRGEFLGMMREAGVNAQGIDLSEESIDLCRQKGLKGEVADLFVWLAAQPDETFDGIFSSQVIEHIAPERLPEMIRLCGAKLRRGGVLAIETPNPECLAIFATHFYLDPTHTRPVPHPLLSFYMEEAGLGRMETHRLSPAIESIPELADLSEGLRNRLFGGLDYAMIGHKL